LSQAHCPQCGCEFDASSAIGAGPLHRAVWSLGVLTLGVLGLLVLYVILDRLSPSPLCTRPAFSSKGKAVADITAIGSALDEYAIANGGKFPGSLDALVTPDVNGQTFLDARHLPQDPWGSEYRYEPPGPGQPKPRVYSYGKDGRPGGTGDDADVDNLTLANRR